MVNVEYEAVYTADVARVLAILTDKAFLAEYAKEIGATDWDIDVEASGEATGGVRTRLRLSVPTDRIPAAFRRFVPPTLEIVEARDWPGTSGGELVGNVAVDTAVGKHDAQVRGTVALTAVPEGTRFSMTGDVVVHLPLVGGRAAGLLKDLIVRVLGNQTTVVNRWIT